MSVLTTTPIKYSPVDDIGVDITTGAVSWTYGDWVPVLLATSADDTAIAGIVIQDVTAWAGAQIEVEFGIGPDEAVVAIGHIRLSGPNSGNGGPSEYRLPYPISGIEPGTQISMRTRQSLGAGSTWRWTMSYYEDLDSDQHVPYTAATLTSFPAGADSIVLTPSATPWDPSAWETFEDPVGENTYIFGAAVGASPANCDWEIDVSDDGATVATSFRGGTYGGARLHMINLPGLLPVTEGGSLVGRVRKSGTDVNTMPVAFLGYEGPLVPVVDTGTIGPLLTITMSYRPPVV